MRGDQRAQILKLAARPQGVQSPEAAAATGLSVRGASNRMATLHCLKKLHRNFAGKGCTYYCNAADAKRHARPDPLREPTRQPGWSVPRFSAGSSKLNEPSEPMTAPSVIVCVSPRYVARWQSLPSEPGRFAEMGVGHYLEEKS